MRDLKKDTSTVHVSLGQRSYDIFIGDNILSRPDAFLSDLLKGRAVFILTDKNVELHHAKNLQETLSESGLPKSVHLMSIPPGEDSKSFEELESVLSWLISNGADRTAVMITVGGGVVGDLGGFAAAVMMRGIDYIQVPTSLLAQVDSAVGGKTAINTPLGKNLVGAFYQPRRVLCDLNALNTLPERQIRAGYAEIAKYGLIDDAEFFIWLENRGGDVVSLNMKALEKAVSTSCRKKAEIVERDEREAGERALLNFGHTFAHVLEAATGYDGRILHGEAVSIGMICALMLSYSLGYCNEQVLERPLEHFRDIGLPVSISEITPELDTSPQDLLALMDKDKKTVAGTPAFVILRKIGQSFVERGISEDDILHVLEKSMTGNIL